MAKNNGTNALVGILAAWIGLFAPGIMLIFGVLPWWGQFRDLTVYKRMLPGVNAAAVGLILAAVFSLALKILQASPFPNASVDIGTSSFGMVAATLEQALNCFQFPFR